MSAALKAKFFARSPPVHAAGFCLRPRATPHAQLKRHDLRNVARPSFGSVEGDDANWIVESAAVEQVGDHRFKIGVFDVDLAPGVSDRPEVVEHQTKIAINAGND